MDWVVNPDTGRKIKIDGPTYNRLKREGVDVDSFSPVEDKENNNHESEEEIRERARELEKFRQ